MASAAYLFLDERFLEETARLQLRAVRPTKIAANPIITPTKPWEGRNTDVFHGTVFYDKEDHVFKMWYRGWILNEDGSMNASICYATSSDGYRWEKPDLGVVEFGGSKRNNIVINRFYPEEFPPMVNPCVVKVDDDLPYRMIIWDNLLDSDYSCWGCRLLSSPDGFRWRKAVENPVWTTPADAHPELNDDVFALTEDKECGKFVNYRRVLPYEKLVYLSEADRINEDAPFVYRIIARAESIDLIHWENHEVVLRPDLYDSSETEFYGLSAFKYHGYYLGLIEVFHAQSLLVDVELAGSYDGKTWFRINQGTPVIPLGHQREFDSGMIYPAREPVLLEDKVLIYYSGMNYPHWEKSSPDDTGCIGVAEWRKDRITCLEAEELPGYLLSKPLKVSGESISANIDASDGEIEAEVLDEKCTVMAGFDRSKFKVVNGDHTNRELTWRERDTRSLKGKTIRLRLYMRNAKLYSISL